MGAREFGEIGLAVYMYSIATALDRRDVFFSAMPSRHPDQPALDSRPSTTPGKGCEPGSIKK
jgi:hypothetical protein